MINSTFEIKERAKSFFRSEDGSASISLAVSLPATLLLFSVGYEGGMSSTRHVLLQHGLEETVREVRIGAIAQPTHANLIASICEHASMIPDCENQVRLEMIQGQVAGWDESTLEGDTVCRDREEDASTPLLEFTNTGSANDLMFLRACALFDPLFAGIGFGKAIATENGKAYALIATSGYVVEPF